MGHSDGDHEREDLSADDSPWSDGVWSSEDDEVCVFFMALQSRSPSVAW
jgi:ribosome biogenesis protein ERB1